MNSEQVVCQCLPVSAGSPVNAFPLIQLVPCTKIDNGLDGHIATDKKTARDEGRAESAFIESKITLIQRVAGRYKNIHADNLVIDIDDLVQVSAIKLLKEYRRLWPQVIGDGLVVTFVGWAVLDLVKSTSFLSEHFYRQQTKIKNARDQLEKKGGALSDSNVMQEAGMSEKDYLKLMQCLANHQAGFTDCIVQSQSFDHVLINELFERIDGLQEMNAQVMRMAYQNDLSDPEIGYLLGIGRNQAFRLRTRAVNELRSAVT